MTFNDDCLLCELAELSVVTDHGGRQRSRFFSQATAPQRFETRKRALYAADVLNSTYRSIGMYSTVAICQNVVFDRTSRSSCTV
jgi:hypothetical protein